MELRKGAEPETWYDTITISGLTVPTLGALCFIFTLFSCDVDDATLIRHCRIGDKNSMPRKYFTKMSLLQKRPYYLALVKEAFRHAGIIPDEYADVFDKIVRNCGSSFSPLLSKSLVLAPLHSSSSPLLIAYCISLSICHTDTHSLVHLLLVFPSAKLADET